MKKIRILSAVLLLCSVPVLAAPKTAPKTAPKIDPATYTISVHVSAARYDDSVRTSPAGTWQILSVVIAGKHYEIEGPTSVAMVSMQGLLNPGDYPAKLTEDTHKSSFESIQIYELLFPDGTTRKFSVILQAE